LNVAQNSLIEKYPPLQNFAANLHSKSPQAEFQKKVVENGSKNATVEEETKFVKVNGEIVQKQISFFDTLSNNYIELI
jgi:hypothetical protein